MSTRFSPSAHDAGAATAAAAATAASLARPAPRVHELTIRGWRVLLQPVATTGIVAVAAFLPSGGAHDPHALAGRTSLMLGLLQKGTRRRDALAWAEAVEDLGSHVGAAATADFSKWSLVAVAPSLEPSLELWAEALHEPRFDADEVAKERDLLLADLRMEEDNSFAFTHRHFQRALFRGTPYQEDAAGAPESVGALEREHLVARHAELLRRGGGVVVATGGFDPDRLVAWLERRLVAPAEPAAAPPAVDPPVRSAAELHTVRKVFEQGFLCVGAPTLPLAHADYAAVRVMAGLLGEGMGSRLFIQLRDEKGLAYATGASSVAGRAVGHLLAYIGTQPDRLDEAREGMLAIFDRLRREAPPEEEMRRARHFIAGRFLFDHQKMSRQAHYLGFFEMMGGSWRDDAAFAGRIAAVTAEQVRAAAERYLAAPLVMELRPPAAA